MPMMQFNVSLYFKSKFWELRKVSTYMNKREDLLKTYLINLIPFSSMASVYQVNYTIPRGTEIVWYMQGWISIHSLWIFVSVNHIYSFTLLFCQIIFYRITLSILWWAKCWLVLSLSCFDTLKSICKSDICNSHFIDKLLGGYRNLLLD